MLPAVVCVALENADIEGLELLLQGEGHGRNWLTGGEERVVRDNKLLICEGRAQVLRRPVLQKFGLLAHPLHGRVHVFHRDVGHEDGIGLREEHDRLALAQHAVDEDQIANHLDPGVVRHL